MKKLVLPILLLLAGSQVFAQTDVVKQALDKYKIDEQVLDAELRKFPTEYSYDLKETVATEGRENVILARYDVSKPEADRWTVISSDDQDPTTAEIRRFNKEHAKQTAPPIKADESTYKVEREDASNLTISFMPDPSSLNNDNMFMKDCRNFLTIDLKSGKIVKVEAINEKPLKVKAFNVPRLNTYAEIAWNEPEKRYFPKKTSIEMEIKLLGQQLPTTTILEYSNFKK